MKYKERERITRAHLRRQLELAQWEKLAKKGDKEAPRKVNIAKSDIANAEAKHSYLS